MMASSVVNLLQTKHSDNVDELTTMLESLPSYEHSKETQEESAIFEDDNEPSTGLINLIRKTSMHSSQIITTNDTSNTIVADDSTSYYSADDDTTTSGTNSTPIVISTNTEEEIIEDNDEEINMNLLKSKMKHLFVLSENGKPVFT
ncbi:unnamed protein product, partial [Adineta steineri]